MSRGDDYIASHLANEQRWEEKRFYTYTLESSLTGVVFYVGKGTAYRVTDHEREAHNGVQSPKCDHIRQIEADGGKVIRKIVKKGLTSYEALALEEELIQQYGPDNLVNCIVPERKSYIAPVQLSIDQDFRDEVDGPLRILLEREGMEASTSSCYQYLKEMLFEAVRERIRSQLRSEFL